MAGSGRRSIELDGREMMGRMILEVTVKHELQAVRRFRRWAWLIALGCRLAGLGGMREGPESKLPGITSVPAICQACEWQGTAGECEPDVDGDGSLGCPGCRRIVICQGDSEAPPERPTWD